MLALCLAEGLSSARDLAALQLASRRLLRVGRQAPVSLRLAEAQAAPASVEDSRRQLARLCASFPGGRAPRRPGGALACPLPPRLLATVCKPQGAVRSHAEQPHVTACGVFEWRPLRPHLAVLAGAERLDAGGTPLEDCDVAALLHALPSLRVLALSGCKKLTAGVTRRLFPLPQPAPRAGSGGASTGAAARPPRRPELLLRTVVMQRCFQLTAQALSDALLAGMAAGGSLAGVALSHLDLRQWPDAPLAAVLAAQSRRSVGEAPWAAAAAALGDGPADQNLLQPSGGSAQSSNSEAVLPAGLACPDEQKREPREQAALPPALAALGAASPARGLRMLALHNCGGVTVGALWALALGCPSLQGLFLGGSSLALQEAGSTAGASPAAAAPAAAGPEAAAVSAPPQAGPLAIELAPGAELPDAFVTSAGGVHSAAAARRAAAAALARLRFACWADPLVLSAAAEFAAVAALLPDLQCLELSFGLPGLVPLLQQLCEEEAEGEGQGGGGGGSRWHALCGALGLHGQRPAVQFWDLCQPDSLRGALAWRRSCRANVGSGSGSGSGLAPPEAAVFLRAAANCSSGAKVTPLHVAAEEGNCGMAEASGRARALTYADWGPASPALAC